MLLKTFREAHRATRAIVAYSKCRTKLIEAGFNWEINWQIDRRIGDLSESDFLKEYAWVVLSCGLSERCVRKRFEAVSEAFFNWQNASLIMENVDRCKTKALNAFSHKLKIGAIADVACRVAREQFPRLHADLLQHGVSVIEKWPFMGPASSRHLAKNIGLNVAKPDRHLLRIAESLRYESVDLMCKELAEISGDSIAVVDLVFWRYATLNRCYLDVIGCVNDSKPLSYAA